MVTFFLRLFLLMSCLSFCKGDTQEMTTAQEEPMVVNSGEAHYDGKEIVLIGDVVVQHGLGKISARRLSLLPGSENDKKRKFALLKIQEDVHLELQGGGELLCQEALVDYSKLQGFFCGNAQTPDVIYRTTNSGETKPSLVIKSYRMVVDLVREAPEVGGSIKTSVKTIQALQNVRIQYNQNYFLLADQAFFQRLPSPEHSLSAGLLTLSAQIDTPTCQLTTLTGDRIQAQTIQVDTVDRHLHLNEPKGTLVLSKEVLSEEKEKRRPAQTLEFSANELIWHDKTHQLELKGQVSVLQNGTTQVTTDHEVTLTQALVEGKKVLQTIQAKRETTLSYLDVQKDLKHTIICHGPLIIDHEHFRILLQSPEQRGPIPEEQQVYIEDVLGDLYADRIEMAYGWEQHLLVPTKIILEGNVRLLSRFNGHAEETSSVLHYALADQMEYLPKEQEMLLFSNEGKRVLFFDKVNNMQMSAPSLKVRKDSTTQKSVIQGIGDVRFTFLERELEQIKQHFHLDKEATEKAKNDE